MTRYRLGLKRFLFQFYNPSFEGIAKDSRVPERLKIGVSESSRAPEWVRYKMFSVELGDLYQIGYLR